ncbi:MAG: hypothetical protein ABIK44_02870 [candidate division WOR-3 bacterium]
MKHTWSGEKVLPIEIIPPWPHVSWVGAVTTVLRARGLEKDFVDVAGMSGYAFVVNIHPELCPSGPTGFDWGMLVEGTQALGLEVELVGEEHDEESDDLALVSNLFEQVREEIDAGRPCVVWGATSAPEFAVVYGYREENYLVRSFRSAVGKSKGEGWRPLGPDQSPEEPVPFNKLRAPGCVAAFMFRDRIDTDAVKAERAAVSRAVQLLRGHHPCFDPAYRQGAQAFTAWAESLENNRAQPFGNAYNTVCYWELQMFASGFCRRLANRHPKSATQLNQAAQELGRSFINLEQLRGLFPFPEGGDLKKKENLIQAATLLRNCATYTEQAIRALELALALM